VIIVVATQDSPRCAALIDRLRREPGVELTVAASGRAVLDQVRAQCPDLVLADEQLDDMTGLALIEQVVQANPMINTALVGALSEDDFHEKTEGLGVLMQVPVCPTEADAERLLRIVNNIGILMPKPTEGDKVC
jgi:CheY-like chemotaxis protein